MRYRMRQKFFAFGDDFVIKDESGREVFYVDGKAFSIGDKLSFQDMAGRELAFIRQRLLSWGKTYEIEQNGQLLAVIKKKLFTFLRCRFTVDVPGPDDLEAAGDLLEHEYTFQRADGRLAARVSKKWFGFADTYGVDMVDSENAILILAASVVIDLCCHGDGDE